MGELSVPDPPRSGGAHVHEEEDGLRDAARTRGYGFFYMTMSLAILAVGCVGEDCMWEGEGTSGAYQKMVNHCGIHSGTCSGFATCKRTTQDMR